MKGQTWLWSWDGKSMHSAPALMEGATSLEKGPKHWVVNHRGRKHVPGVRGDSRKWHFLRAGAWKGLHGGDED